MGHENTSATLVLENAVDVLKEGLLRIGVEGRSLGSWLVDGYWRTIDVRTYCLIEEQKLWILQN
jgi:hypothetical protein